MLSEYNQRQLDRLVKTIDDYEKKNLSLSATVSQIEGLIGVLENIPITQRNELVRRWGVLDEIFAICLDEANRRPNHEENVLINQALSELKRLCLSFSE